MARTTAPKKAASRTRAARAPRAPATRRRTSAADQRRFLAADIAAATLVGYRDGEAAAMARQAIATPLIATTLDPYSDRPIKILADGTHCAPGDTRTDHIAVLLPAAGLMIHPVTLGTAAGEALNDLDACLAACRDLRVLGYSDWQLARREDWNHVLDLRRHDPAVDPNLYPGIKPAWHWTSSDCAWAEKDAAGRSASAWSVYASSGGVCGGHRYNFGFALAVRRVGQ